MRTAALPAASVPNVIWKPSGVVWGMPGALAEAGLADEIAPVGEIPGAVMALAGPKGRR